MLSYAHPISTYSVDKWITLHEVSLEVEKDRVREVAEKWFPGENGGKIDLPVSKSGDITCSGFQV